ncbi:alkaline phosphatase family protein [Cryobacterium sp. TMT1-21]|uniref:Alkaline phosphatase family protein n=1 Tax=Cryobacterium shii TaxID=1259235 RepID=A0AAQ2HH94_9MICO|nr:MULTISPECIES: nucleotide pyrophosphatase/phosphodiesterase family protein [Cryobacterium]TFC52608.1 alkaline phosphatase family protein [Cryobacterium shii]TFC82390.1 alkaline phosphatase family protein [Cryobacterium sp. TmT2-59]TFD16392.1 alkaline phosphatase family protein [Cryobacterium sp. TMT1-21]TFD17705.1 alkaline phosphatase family protein [Cryobacterium sp. TMT4-10]TFD27982.1 alkaline phosphatase family protein [Cryobacterium sp. TMT2-23]
MPSMLPARQFSPLRLADVLASSLSSVLGRPNPLGLGPASKAVVVLADGLGVSSLRARAGHARFLNSLLTKTSVVDGVFPSTTAAGIATLTTGVPPGQHGLVGYRVFDAERDRVVNQLTGWDAGMQPEIWQRQRTVFQQATDAGVPGFAIGPRRYAASGFTQAVLRGARYVSAESLADRFAAARHLLDTEPRALVYLYVPELDVAAHAQGWESARWLAELETLDGALARFAGGLRADEGLLVTADHGIVDVPSTRQVLFDTVPELVANVRHIGGDPRCVQLYLEPGLGGDSAQALADAWSDVEGARAWVFTREDAIRAGLFGEIAAEVRPRIGDVIVAARKLVAYYDSRESNQSARSMVGQHGSLTDEELRVPLIRSGAFSN